MTAADGLEAAASAVLEARLGRAETPATAVAPGRATLVGEHVDYVGGRVACLAINLRVGVAVRPSRDRRWRVCSGVRMVDRAGPDMAGDVGDRILAAAVALQRRGIVVPALEIAAAATLPESAGLSSSAAVTCATLVAILRLTNSSMDSEALVAAAVEAERDIVGVPAGELDQRAIVHCGTGSVLLLDCARGTWRDIRWPWPGAALVVADSGERHDVGGADYRARRTAAERACTQLGVGGCQEIGDRWRELSADLQPAARHIATETSRSDAAAAALEASDLAGLGRLLSASHRSLRDDLGVSTPTLDAMVDAADRVPGCHGARLVGAGFGGSVVALVDLASAAACLRAMTAVTAGEAFAGAVQPCPGLRTTCADVLTGPESAEPSDTL